MEEKKPSSDNLGNHSEGDKALWDLLGSARKVEAGPMFSRNVLREVRKIGDEKFSWRKWFQSFTKPAIAMTAAAILIFSGIVAIQNQEFANISIPSPM